MTARNTRRGRAASAVLFDAEAFLEHPDLAGAIVQYARGATVFTQGDASDDVLYIQTGGVKLSVVSNAGRECVVAMLGPGEFFGEGCLAGQTIRMGSATAIMATLVRVVAKGTMIALLQEQRGMSDRFIAHMLSRNIRIEQDLVDQLFNSSEKRLARALLLLARYGNQDPPGAVVPKVSQETLAKMVGTTRSRVNFFLNKFKRLGFIDYGDDVPLTINHSLNVVLNDEEPR